MELKTRPINFNGEMVRALLAGRKTQTRRPIKTTTSANGCHKLMSQADIVKLEARFDIDYLWVRETWGPGPIYRADKSRYEAMKKVTEWGKPWNPPAKMPQDISRLTLRVKWHRTEGLQDISEEAAIKEGARLRDTSEEVGRWHVPDIKSNQETFVFAPDAPTAFRNWWGELYGEDGPFSWENNPVVHVCEFEVIEANVNTLIS